MVSHINQLHQHMKWNKKSLNLEWTVWRNGGCAFLGTAMHVSFVRQWMNLDFGKIVIMLDVRYLHFEYFVPQPPHPSVSLNLRVQWIVLPWEWDAARMMATITLHPNTYLVRHSSLWGFQFQNVIHACSRYGYNHCTQCSVLYIQTYISYNVATQLKASGTNCWL